MASHDSQRIQYEEHVDLWHDKLIQAHFMALPAGISRSSFIMRPPNLEEALRELTTFGKTILGSHEDDAEADAAGVEDWVCSVHLRGRENEDPVIGDGSNSTLAALRCLREVLSFLAAEAADGFSELEEFLSDH